MEYISNTLGRMGINSGLSKLNANDQNFWTQELIIEVDGMKSKSNGSVANECS